MKIAIIGSRSIKPFNIGSYIPEECTEIVSGGAKGVDTFAALFSKENRLILTEFLPDYKKYGRAAPIVRNKEIVDYADTVIAFWDGKSKGTAFVINYCKQKSKPCKVINIKEG